MESLDAGGDFMDDLPNFSSDIGEEEADDVKNHLKHISPPVCLNGHALGSSFDVLKPDYAIPETVEEELEWILNKDAFPALGTFIVTEQPVGDFSKHQSPVSVLENRSNNHHNCGTMMSCCVSLGVPVRARSKLPRKRRMVAVIATQYLLSQELVRSTKPPATNAAVIGRKCQHCGAEKTPQWRAGPLGAKTLCNACGVRYKSGRLCPEYRPASSRNFSSKLHSNSHRKIMEMKKKKQTEMMR